MGTRSLISIYLMTAAAALGVAVLLEGGVRIAEASMEERIASDMAGMMSSVTDSEIAGREIGNQMLVHNLTLFARHPHPERVDTAYVGTSRTKIMRPAWTGQENAVNGSGNSYNEISYGLLLQAEVVRQRFPNVKRMYIESSLLLRRPDRLIVEPDHRKYLPVLEVLLPLRDHLPGADKFRAQVAEIRKRRQPSPWTLQLLTHRTDMRLSKLWPAGQPEHIPVAKDTLFTELSPAGERKLPPPVTVPKAQQRPEIANENIKVQRLRNIREWAPWDGLFDMVALWGRRNGIEIVLFQPPVRSDLYRYQQEFGLAAHVSDLQRVVSRYRIPFIDLNRPDLGYMADWALFSDEDHLETCAGVALLHAALTAGERRFHERGELLPVISREEAARLGAPWLRRCESAEAGGQP